MYAYPVTESEAEPSYLSGLNRPQLEAVRHFKGPILVLAGAGSGKTRVLTRRIAHLVLGHKVKPENILAVTFTNKATDEMRVRLRSLLGRQADELWVSTFHSAGLRILRRHAQLLSYSRDFVVYDDKDSGAVLKEVLESCDINTKKHPPAEFERAIDQAKNAGITPEDFLLKYRPPFLSEFERRQLAEVYDFYQKALRKASAMDFGDLLLNSLLILQGHPEVRGYYQRQLRFILVDEFQDTNEVQYEFLRQLTSSERNLLVVGDDDQSIYAFRGATIRNILEFERQFPEVKIVKLEQNYRSTGNILEGAYNVIKHNKDRRDKRLWTSAEAGLPLFTFAGHDEGEEAAFIVQELKALKEQGKRWGGTAIFYRTNAQSRAIEEALVNHGIPYRIYGGLKFYERKEIKDIVAYLRLIAHDSDTQAFLRVVNTPPRGIGAQTVQNITDCAEREGTTLLAAARELASKNKNVAKFVGLIDELKQLADDRFLSVLIHDVIEKTEYAARLRALKDPNVESRLENLAELEAIGRSMDVVDSGNHSEALQNFLDRVTLTSSDETPEGSTSPEAVTLMTLHLAKGLEFPTVFLTGFEEGLLPHHRSINSDKDIEEERRLCYVGMTRAMETLYITRTYCRGMFSGGGSNSFYREPSRFLYGIPEELLEGKTLATEYQNSDL